MKRVALLGDRERQTAFARVNRAWAALLKDAGWSLDEQAPVRIHHDYSQDFASVQLPADCLRVAVRTWDFGPFPPDWVARLNTLWDELWVHSQWIRELACRGGVDEQRIRVLPHGVDPQRFRPDRPPYAWTRPEGEFRFLFVGASVHRKGLDTLLKAYRQAFTADDNVCLVLKDHTRDVFYQGLDARAQLEDGGPRLLYLDEYLLEEQLASLMTSCHAGVFPYRAEGFALPILEAMACGLPCIVPRFGACLDYCHDENAILVPVRRMQLPVGGRFAFNTLGFHTDVQEVDFCEIRPEVLGRCMRELFEGERELLRQRGLRASAEVHARWSWSACGQLLTEWLAELTQRARNLPVMPAAEQPTKKLAQAPGRGPTSL